MDGTDGSTTPELVTLRVTVHRNTSRDLWIAGRCVARRPGRDVPVQLGEKVVIVSGEFPWSAGSVRYPALQKEDSPPVVLEVRDVPRPAAEAAVCNRPWRDVEIVR